MRHLLIIIIREYLALRSFGYLDIGIDKSIQLPRFLLTFAYLDSKGKLQVTWQYC